MKTNDETINYIKYRTLCPLPPECMEQIQNEEDIEIKKDTSLDLSSQNLEDISFLKSYKNLRVLSLRRNKIKDISVLAGLTQLEELDLSYNQIEDFSPLENLKHLKKIAPQKLNKYLADEPEGNEVILQFEKPNKGWYKKIKNPRIEKSGFFFKKVSVTWDCITFGSYPQDKVFPMKQQVKSKLIADANCDAVYKYKTGTGQVEKYFKKYSSYYKYESIRWRVLQIKNGKALLLSDKILDVIPFDSFAEINKLLNWETCYAYRHLNSEGGPKGWFTKEIENRTFMKMAFSQKEREAIMKRESGYVSFLPYDAISDAKYASYGLFDLFARGKLSIDPFNAKSFTDYAEANHLKCSKEFLSTGEMAGTAPWWLGTILSKRLVYYVESSGKINSLAYAAEKLGMRPVIEVDLTKLDENDVQITAVCVGQK